MKRYAFTVVYGAQSLLVEMSQWVALVRNRSYSCSIVSHNQRHSMRRITAVGTRIIRSRSCSQQCSDTTVANTTALMSLYTVLSMEQTP